MFILFELLFTGHLSAVFHVLVVLGLIYTLLLVIHLGGGAVPSGR